MKMKENNEADERIIDIGKLAGGLVHEIKNPLSTLTINLQLLKEELKKPKDQKEERILKKIKILEKETRRLEEILNDFLRFAREEELELRSHNINTCIEEVLDFMEPDCKQKNIHIRKYFDQEIPQIEIDSKLMKQAFLNIILNANDAMEEKGGELMVRTYLDSNFIIVDLIDTGCGIEKDKISKIFDVYYSTGKVGTGLGLATTKKIISRHNGKISVHSEPDKGTSFQVRLPITKN